MKDSPIDEVEVTIGPHGLKGTLTLPQKIEDDTIINSEYAPPTTKVALILHGQAGHRNYCYQRLLAHLLSREQGIYTLRIDFRGCGASPDGPNLETEGRLLKYDLEDIQNCAEFLVSGSNPLGIKFSLSAVIGHSRGSLAMMLWALEQTRMLHNPETRSKAIIVPSLVNCSSRYRLTTVFDRYPPILDDFPGVHQTCLRHGKMEKVWVPIKELLLLGTPDMDVMSELAVETLVLSIYGLNDHIVPVEDLAYFANALNRGHQLHKLIFIKDADHNFYGTNEIITEEDVKEHNQDGHPVKNGYVNFNPLVTRHIVEYLSPVKEFERFLSTSESIGHVKRWKQVEGILNFRDVGGWNITQIPRGLKLSDDKHNEFSQSDVYVRPGIIFRCANTVRVTDSGVQEMAALKIKTLFDLRSDSECSHDGIAQGLEKGSITRVHAPVFSQDDYSPQAVFLRYQNLMTSWYTYVHVYDKLLTDAISTFRLIFEYIRDEVPKGNSLVYHCTAGKDRTGVLTMLILLLAGVDKDTVAREYELTTFGLTPDHPVIKDKFISTLSKIKAKAEAAGISAELMEKELSQGRENWTLEEDGFKNLISSRFEAMLSTIELFETKYGGIINYMKEYLKFSDEDIVTIYHNIVKLNNDGGFEDYSFVNWSHRAPKNK